MHQNLYQIDDVLLRAGRAALLLVGAAAALVVLVGLASGSANGQDAGLAALARHGAALALATLCPIALLGAGFTLRRREKRIVAVWSLLKQNAELRVPELLANSDFERRDLSLAVRVLNNRGLGHYVWDRKSDTIQDGRLRSSSLHVEKCDACGAAVSLEIPLGFHDIPRCPYCHDPVSLGSIDDERREALESLRAPYHPTRSEVASSSGSRGAFSLPLFLVLLFVFWPAGVVYAWLKWQGKL